MNLRTLWNSTPSDFRTGLRDRGLALADFASTASVWNWHRRTFPGPGAIGGHATYVGRRRSATAVASAFGASGNSPADPCSAAPNGIVVTELPLAGAFRVPEMVRFLIDVRPPMETLTARSSRGVWRGIPALAARARVVPVVDPHHVERVATHLLEAYAAGRDHAEVCQIPIAEVRALAAQGGLVSIHLDGEEVAARISYSYQRGGRRYYAASRFGYPSHVFADPARYRSVNGLNTYLAIQHARDTGHDVMDFGVASAHPLENGLFQFKRMRATRLSLVNCRGYYSVRVPRHMAPQFLWARPLLSVSRGQLTLNVGVPQGLEHQALLDRLRKKLLCAGMSAVRLYSSRPVDSALPSAIAALCHARAYQADVDEALTVDVVACPEG